MTTLGELGEFGFIERIAKILPGGPDVIESIGDDCAVLRVGSEQVLLTTDMAVEDVHFRWGAAAPQEIGWKIAASALSDIAAMGGAPIAAFTSLAAPSDASVEDLERLYQGIGDAVRHCGAAVAGGDTTRSPKGVVVDITVVGRPAANRYLTRRGARPGDALMVTGFPGRLAAGVHAQENGHGDEPLIAAHYHPLPRLREGQWLCARESVHAAIDVSDGLGQDAGQVAKASGLTADIQRASLPIAKDLAEYCERYGLNAEEFALSGGEAYELIVAVAPDAAASLSREFKDEFDLPLTALGEFSKGAPIVTADGQPIKTRGFDHFRD